MYRFATLNGRNYKVYERKSGTRFVVLNGKRQDVDIRFVMVSASKPCNGDKERLSNGKCYKKCKSPHERSTSTFKCEKKPKVLYLEKQGNEEYQARIPRGDRNMILRDIYRDLNKNPLITLNHLAKATGITLSKNGKRLKKSELVNELRKYIRFNE